MWNKSLIFKTEIQVGYQYCNQEIYLIEKNFCPLITVKIDLIKYLLSLLYVSENLQVAVVDLFKKIFLIKSDKFI